MPPEVAKALKEAKANGKDMPMTMNDGGGRP